MCSDYEIWKVFMFSWWIGLFFFFWRAFNELFWSIQIHPIHLLILDSCPALVYRLLPHKYTCTVIWLQWFLNFWIQNGEKFKVIHTLITAFLCKYYTAIENIFWWKEQDIVIRSNTFHPFMREHLKPNSRSHQRSRLDIEKS